MTVVSELISGIEKQFLTVRIKKFLYNMQQVAEATFLIFFCCVCQ